MAKKFRRFGALVMALVMCASMLGTTAFAAENDWQGTVAIPEGPEGYPYMLFGAPDDGIYYYETSHHTVKKEATGGGAVHVLALINSELHNGTWTVSEGEYTYGKSNYDIVYCCDAATGSEAGDFYKRLNLEDSEYFTAGQAKKLRAILTNAYPYLSVEDAKAALKAAGFAQADELDRSELITATQAAVWSIANAGNGDSYVYNKTASTPQKNTWGGNINDFSDDVKNFTDSPKKTYTIPDGVGDRVNALREFYLNLEGVEAANNQIVISKFAFVGKPVAVNDEEFSADLEIVLNHSGSGNQNVDVTVTVGNDEYRIPVVAGQTTYNFSVTAKQDDTIRAVVSGYQALEKGVYFYAPRPQDVNGDGIATSREVSQNLIGVAEGKTPVYSEAELTVEFENVTFKSGDVSNISYMFLNKDTGAVEFIKKIDIDDGITSVPVVTMDGYVSVIFMKQATSGMFWFSEEVSEAEVNAAIASLKANNPSYKGHNAICFGEGDHTLEFKTGKFVTYSFNAGAVCDCSCSSAPVIEEPVETEPSETEPVETEPVETEPVETEPVETEPAETEPAETEPVETEPDAEEESENKGNNGNGKGNNKNKDKKNKK